MQRLRRHISYLKHAQLATQEWPLQKPFIKELLSLPERSVASPPKLRAPVSMLAIREIVRERVKVGRRRYSWVSHILLSRFFKEQDPEFPLTNKSKSEIQKWQILLDSIFHEEVFVFLASWVIWPRSLYFPENRWLLYKLSTLPKPSASHSKPPLTAFSTASLCSLCPALYFYLTWHWGC